MKEEANNTSGKCMEITISGLKANVYSILLIIPIIIIFSMSYFLLWERNLFKSLKILIQGKSLVNIPLSDSHQILLLGLIILIIGAALHELIHGIACALYCKKGYKSFKFGIIWKALAPYAHCKEPLTVKAYRIVIIMPGLMLGIIPSTIGIVLGNSLVAFFGMIFTSVAGGDIIMFWLTRKLQSNTLVQDIPDRIGCYIIENKSLD